MDGSYSIETQGLGRVYKIRNPGKKEAKTLTALEGVDLQIQRGELFRNIRSKWHRRDDPHKNSNYIAIANPWYCPCCRF